MGFLATKGNRASLKIRIIFSVLTALIGTLCFEGFRSLFENYSFEWISIVVFFLVNFLTVFGISYYSLKIMNAK